MQQERRQSLASASPVLAPSSGSAAATPGFVINTVSGAVLAAWLSLVCFVQAYRLRDRELHWELVHEIDALRQELDDLKSFR